MKNYLEDIALHKNNIYTAHIEPEDYDFHTHSGYQLTYIIGGTTYLIINGMSYLIPTRHFVWIPPNTNHKFTHGLRKALSVYNIYAPIIEQHNNTFFDRIGIYPAPNILIEILKTTTNKIITTEDEEFKFLNSFFKLLPKLIDHSFEMSLPIAETKPIVDISYYILNNLDQKLSLSFIAKKFNISERTLSRLFLSQLQTTFLKYIKLARTIKAIELLLEDNNNITEIAQKVGYSSIASFSNAFVQMTNKRPTDFLLNAKR